MAYYAALTTLVNLVEDILLHDQYPYFLLGKHPVMESFHKNLTLLEESLEGYSSKGDKANDCVEGRIRGMANRAQDIIEFEILNQVSAKEKPSVKKRSFNKSLLHRKMISTKDSVEEMQIENEFVEKLGRANQEIIFLLEKMKKIKEMQTTKTSEDLNLDWDSFDTSASKQAPINRNIMEGFDEYLTTILDQLCGHSSQLQVISIVGIGGIGKTTLARHTYDDALVVYRFDRRAWVVASQDFNVNQFLQTIAKSLGIMNEKLHGKDDGVLKERIYKHLKGRRYLVVIDDIWSTKVWDDVKQIFPNDTNGSRIMLTTRLLDVAEYASTSDFLHKMHFLNDDQSWNLLRQKVFGQEHCPLEMEGIGKLIARCCCGLPLAIVVIAGVLSTVMTTLEWKKIAARVREILSDTDEQFSRILSLSYNHLSHQLKACFLYMRRFPEDHEINISKLIKLWVAEGFLKSTDRTKIFEVVAGECLTDLVKRNLIIITKKRSNGQAKFCILHDLLRDFCRQRAFHENFFHEIRDNGYLYPKASKKVRRINLYCNALYRSRHKQKIGKLLRSIHLSGEEMNFNFSCFNGARMHLLRVYDEFGIDDGSINSIPAVLFQLHNLKYLGFGRSFGLKFPLTFMFQNLQSLIIQIPFSEEVELPPQIWKMTQLRHLVVPNMMLPSDPKVFDSHMKKLDCLQTLMTVRDFKVTNDAIELIPNLRKLKMEYFVVFDEDGWELYCLNNLFNISRLEELKLALEGYLIGHLPSEFAFPLNLRKLSLKYCGFSWKYLTLVGSLPHLQVLRLERNSFVGERWEPKENEFLCLKFLLLEALDLKYWQVEETHFPCLEHLKIRWCYDLDTIPLEIGEIPTLKVINAYGSTRIEESAIRIQEEQRNLGNDGLHVYTTWEGWSAGN